MVEDDGLIRVTCEYCSRTYAIAPEAVNQSGLIRKWPSPV